MTFIDSAAPWHATTVFWHLITRLGEMQILLPALLLAAGVLLCCPGGMRPALVWLAGTLAATLLTTASKVAFIGYGIGLPALDFTGISGHAMFAAAVLPPLLRLAGAVLRPQWPRAPLVAGCALAALVAVSRVMVQAHSWSEVIAGAALGAAVSGLALRTGRLPALRLDRWLPVALLAWAVLGVAAAPPPRTHDWVTRLALAQSGRARPYHRWEMHRDHPRQRAQPGAMAVSLQPG